MSEIKTPIKTLNGHALEDTEARAKVNQLSEEIADIRTEVKNEATASGNTVRIEPEAGSALKVVSTIAADGAGVSQVKLTHSGKNLARLRPAKSGDGWEMTSIGLSEATLEGTGTSRKYMDMMPHVMRATQEVITVTMPSNVTFEYMKNGAWAGYIKNGQSLMVNGSVGDQITGYFMAMENTTVSGSIKIQIEIGALATGYEAATETVYTVDLPHPVVNGEYDWSTGVLTDSYTGENVTVSAQTINAYGGLNVLWSDTGATSVTYKRLNGTGGSNGSTVIEKPFDYKAYALPVLYLTGDTSAMNKDDAVDLGYVYGDMNGTLSLKWQGASSLVYPKKNYTAKFDKSFEAVEGWGAQKKYCLKANWIDFSHSRNLVCAKLWGQICANRGGDPLADCPNYGAVDGFPIVIVLNDEFMGVYTMNIPKDGWMANMPAAGATQEAILCADNHIAATQFKASATLDGDFEVEYITNEDNTDWAKNSLNTLINACVASNGSDLDTTIASMLDWNRAIDYYIFTVLIRGDDMIDKNYLLIKRENKPWLFGGYDMDCTFGLYWDGSKWVGTKQWTTFSDVASKHRVMELIRTYKRAELVARYEELRESVLSEDNVAVTFLNFAGMIPRPLLDEDNRKWPTIPNTNVNNVQQIFDWYRRRCTVIDAEIEKLK